MQRNIKNLQYFDAVIFASTWEDPDIRKMYFEAIKFVLAMTEGSTTPHAKATGMAAGK